MGAQQKKWTWEELLDKQLSLALQHYSKGPDAPGMGEKLMISIGAAGMLGSMCIGSTWP